MRRINEIRMDQWPKLPGSADVRVLLRWVRGLQRERDTLRLALCRVMAHGGEPGEIAAKALEKR